MDNKILIAILDDVMGRLEEAIGAVEEKLPEEFRSETKGFLGEPRSYYAVMAPLHTLSSSLSCMLDNLRDGK
jgi:hypothetical protein